MSCSPKNVKKTSKTLPQNLTKKMERQEEERTIPREIGSIRRQGMERLNGIN